MVICARCGRDVDAVQHISPDLITNELIESVDDGEADMASEEGIAVCAECMDELTGS